MEKWGVESTNTNNKTISQTPTNGGFSQFIEPPIIDLEPDQEEDSPIEQVRLTVSNKDDPTLPVWTFRMWFLGLISCSLLSFLDQFFAYRTEPLMITMISVQIASLPIGHFMAAVLPAKKFKIVGFGERLFSLNPGPFNIKEHVLITMFANAGTGSAYGVSIVNVIIAFYHRKISFLTAWLLVLTTQVLGYGWAGLLRKYVVEPAHMWWPGTLAQVSLFRALHEKEIQRLSRAKFFLIALACSFSWYIIPGYFFSTVTSIAWICWIFPKSVTAQHVGSGLNGLGIGAFTLDWSTISSYLGSPLVTPFFSIVNILVGYILLIYVFTPIAYWGFDLYGAQKYPLFSTKLFTSQGHIYDTNVIVNDQFELDLDKYKEEGKIHLSMFFALTYGFGFASTLSTITHVILFYGRDTYKRFRSSNKEKEDVHTRLMKKYEDIPSWWFHGLLGVTIVVSLVLCIALNKQVQLPWWGFLLSCFIAIIYTLPISILVATTNMAAGLNEMTDYIMGILYSGRPVANIAFKVYCVSVWQAISFLGDFKLGHYMKIPPRSMFLVQVLGYGWAGLLRKYVVEPAHMWWPGTLVQVSLFRALHEKEIQRLSRAKFFLIALACSFCWYLVPGYLFTTVTSIAGLCWIFPTSVTAQQIGSGLKGFGIGAFTLDWSTISSYLGSPLVTPFFSILNVLVGYLLVIYVLAPVAYWGFDLYDAKKFPIFSTKLFTSQGHIYDTNVIVNDRFELDIEKYTQEGRIHLSMFFALNYGIGFASTLSTVTHVILFHGRKIYQMFRASYKEKEDIHTRMMKKYKDIPSWWFHVLLGVTIVVSLVVCIALNKQVQLPWWGFLLACCIAIIYTLPISVLIATANRSAGLNYMTDYIMGLLCPGKPIANVTFKVYCVSVWHAVSFLSHFKLGHYMKIPPRSMFLVQLIGTIISGTINVGVAWWLLHSIENICQDNLLPPNSPWTCPYDRILFDTSVIWGLVGPKRIFGAQGNYRSMNWFFLGGALGPIIVYLIHKAFPKQTWIPLVNFPVLLGAAGAIPPAMPLNYNTWIIIGVTFNYFIFRYKTKWWQRYNYILSAALDTGVALMAVLLFFTLGKEKKEVTWWGTQGEHCPLASCPTAKGITLDGCPLY